MLVVATMLAQYYVELAFIEKHTSFAPRVYRPIADNTSCFSLSLTISPRCCLVIGRYFCVRGFG